SNHLPPGDQTHSPSASLSDNLVASPQNVAFNKAYYTIQGKAGVLRRRITRRADVHRRELPIRKVDMNTPPGPHAPSVAPTCRSRGYAPHVPAWVAGVLTSSDLSAKEHDWQILRRIQSKNRRLPRRVRSPGNI